MSIDWSKRARGRGRHHHLTSDIVDATTGEPDESLGDGEFLGLALSGDAPTGPQTLYVGPDDPGTVGAGAVWIDTTFGPPYAQKVRNADDDDWDNAQMVTYHENGELASEMWADPTVGRIRLYDDQGVLTAMVDVASDANSGIYIQTNDGVGDPLAQIHLGPGGVVELIGTGLFAFGSILPTANPSVAGQLWNDGGTVKVSAG